MKLFFIPVLLFSFSVFGQQIIPIAKPVYPQDYFRNPLNIPIFLAGNFGECRPGHFHSGIDIKTLGEENQPVYAAAEGFVSRIKMESGGFGHGLYITHPNGYTTLYAHLNKFAPAIQKYVEEQQYAQKKWNVDLQLSAGQFMVKKGEQVAWSGNTGASTAPHLHFEIRNSKNEHPLNPQLFGLKVVDKLPPVPAEVVLFFGQSNIQGSFYENEKSTISLIKRGEVYKPLKTDNTLIAKLTGDTVVIHNAQVGVGINVDDYMDGSDNTISFYTADLYVDDSIQTRVTLDNIGYDESRYINAYTDFKVRQLQKKWVQCLFQLPGNHLDGIYTYLNAAKGKIRFDDSLVHKLAMVITDDRDNQSMIQFYAKVIRGTEQLPNYNNNIGTPFYANRLNVYNDEHISFSLDNKQLYDDINFTMKVKADSELWSDKYQLHYAYVPVHHYFDLQIKPIRVIPAALSSKVVMYYSDDKDVNGRAAAMAENGWYKAKVRNFGTYWLGIDTTAPVIKCMHKDGSNLAKAKQILFEVKDATTSVRSFSGYLDGKWICFEQHSSKFFYNFDKHCNKGKHELVFKAEDENGNEQKMKLNFTR